MEHEQCIVGKRVPRVDAYQKVTGKALYVDDIRLPRMLIGKTLKSPHPHARILSIDTSKAKQLPGVAAVLTSRDIPLNHRIIGRSIADLSVLCDDKVRFIGDEVAAVAAVDEETAEKALELIDVKYEVLPAVFDVEEAMKPESPRIHEEFSSNIVSSPGFTRGDPEAEFKEADAVVENTFKTQQVDQTPIEPHGAVAMYEPWGQLTVWVPTQAAFQERIILSRIFGIPQSKIRVVTPVIGGAFGEKDCSRLNYICAALARKVGDGRPVKLIHNREEEFICNTTRHPIIVHMKMGARKDGKITASELRLIVDNGAYTDYGEFIAGGMFEQFGGTYKIPNVRCEAHVVYTNSPFGGAMRGFGNPQLNFAREQIMDMLAESLGMNPVEFRLKNALETGDVKPSGWKLSSCALKDCIREAAENIRWKEKWGKRISKGTKVRGVGLGCSEHWSCWRGGYNVAVWRTGYSTPEELYKVNPKSPFLVIGEDGTVRWRYGFEPGQYDADPSSCVLIVNDDGSVNLHLADVDRGQGSFTALAMIVAEELGVNLEDVTVRGVDTEVGAFSPGTYASRATLVSGNAVRRAAQDAKKILFKYATAMLEARLEDLEAKNGKIYVKDTPSKYIWIADAAFKAYGTRDGGHIIVKGYYDPDSQLIDPRTGKGALSSAWIYVAQAAEVEVDTTTGEVKVLKIVSTHDSGTIVNIVGAEGQVDGSASQGLGYTFTEYFDMHNGRLMNPNLLRYIIPSAADIPSVKSIFVKSYEPRGPFGAKGLGEPGLVDIAPAIANAIYDAVGVRISELPITPDKLLSKLAPKGSM